MWSAAAMILWQCRMDDPEVPVDPELYVASQRVDRDAPDPWADVASPQAAERYRKRIQRIVRQLRSELNHEIRLAEGMILRGRPLGDVLGSRNSRISPLSRYIVAQRALRRDLADHWSRGAAAQHQSCPLYRNASLSFLSADEYPTDPEPAESLHSGRSSSDSLN
ncbi:hypothetical protein [Paludisphaera mucosa]|uniref:Uncharacterized protein n=1 Tax=Paludisphaera mucosa TaxID=3030827 RepID=A0ABT6FGH2_9BACT|nr:hypothetical protein [Paludisphaera mucosa]MDG3006683.1 hypothetical protein [Paludisphaera mucosa]